MEVKPFPTQIRFSLTVEESLQLASLGMILSKVNIADPKFFKHELISAYQEQLKGSTFDQIKEFSRGSNEYGTILLKGLPIDPV